MNEKYKELTELVTHWFKNKEQDVRILRSLYSQAYLNESPIVDRTVDLKQETKFSKLSQEDFVKKFNNENFVKLGKVGLKHLFQELHNRYMKEKGFEVTRNVEVVIDKEQQAYGYVCYSDDLLYVNKYAIDQAKTIEPHENNFNKNNVGYSLMYIISHESQHVAQYETAIDFALGRKQDKQTAFLGAMGIIKNTNFQISNEKHDDYIDYWRDQYDYRYVEHNANYSAFKNVDKQVPTTEKTNDAYAQYTKFLMALSLRTYLKADKNFIQDRIQKMEEFALKEIEYFTEGTEDCPMKEHVLEVANAYMKVDEKGNSPFRKEMKKQITEFAKAADKLEKLRQAETKQKGEEEALAFTF